VTGQLANCFVRVELEEVIKGLIPPQPQTATTPIAESKRVSSFGQSGPPQPVVKRPFAYEVGNISGSTVAYIRAARRKDFCRVNGSSQPPASRPNAIVYEQVIEADTLVPQRVTLINADYSRRESFYIFAGSKSWPSQRVVTAKGFNPIAHRAPIIVEVDQNAVILG
jgi:hypothetical protein